MKRVVILAATLAVAAGSMVKGQTEQPIASTTATDHWLMSSFEFMDYAEEGPGSAVANFYIHGGFDIPADPWPNGPSVTLTAAGCVNFRSVIIPIVLATDSNEEAHMWIAGETPDTRQYIYGHLNRGSLLMDFDECGSAGDPIGKLWDWAPPSTHPSCEPSHLHYEVVESAAATHGQKLDPSTTMLPAFNDTQPPEIVEVSFCKDDDTNPSPQWLNCIDAPPSQCVTLADVVDILVRLKDQHGTALAGTVDPTIAPRLVRYRTCPPSGPCENWIEAFNVNQMDKELTLNRDDLVKTLYSVRQAAPPVSPASKYVSDADYCAGDSFWMVVTNVTGGSLDASGTVVGGQPDVAGSWDVTGPDGYHAVIVEVTDHDGNTTTEVIPVCVGVTGPQIIIRDATTDRGFGPPCYTCPEHASPDITLDARPFLLYRGANRRVTARLRVCMTNVGNGRVAMDTPIRVTVQLAKISGKTRRTRARVARRIPAEALETRKALEISGDWESGQERCMPLDLVLRSADVPAGDMGGYFLLAKIYMDGDEPEPGATPLEDGNQATRSIASLVEDLPFE